MLIIQLYIQEIAFSFQMIQIKCINHWRMLFHFWRLRSVCSVGKNAGLFHMSTFTFPDMVLNITSRHVYLSMSKEHFHGTVSKKFLKGFPSYVILVVLFNLHFHAILCSSRMLWQGLHHTAWKVSVFEIFLVCIFRHLDWIQKSMGQINSE